MDKHHHFRLIFNLVLGITTALLTMTLSAALAQSPNQASNQAIKGPWTDKSLSPDKRADLLIEQMTLDEKIAQLHNTRETGKPLVPAQWLGGECCFFPGVPRLGIPDIQMTDGRSGVGSAGRRSRYATALPSALAYAASWDLKLASEYGSVLGRETREHGFGLVFSGTANIIREPRNGRNFECLGEDPILVGKMLGREMKATQDQQVIANINRYAVNDQETGRGYYNANLDERSMRESDLLAFEIAIKESDVGTVMCADTRIKGDYDCENSYLLNDLLKKVWGYKGWVLCDWESDHSTVKSVLAGLDQENPWDKYLGDTLKAAVEKGEVPMARLNDMVHRILRTEIALGVFDNPPVPTPVDPFSGAEVAQRVAEQSIVLLKNSGGQLPLKASRVKSIAVIGSHADVGVLSGGGSDQVDAGGGNAVPPPSTGRAGGPEFGLPVWHRSSPLKAIRAKAPTAKVEYDPGTDSAAAAKLAAASEVAIVFVHQHTTEGRDVPNISLPGNQDQLVSQVAAANPHTIVVLETGGPVLMPWIEQVSAALEAWYPGIKGGEAIANILFGEANPSAKLPVTFPKNEDDVPHHAIPASPSGSEINYTEGVKVGYKWFDAEGKEPLFPFGFGLSYTTFAYSGLKTTPGMETQVSFNVTNTGKRAGAEIVQVYVSLPPSTGEPPKRLVAWDKIQLGPGETKSVTLTLDPHYLSIFNVDKKEWELAPGEYKVQVGGSSRSTPLTAAVRISEAQER
jgi:beta-glucosidase